MTTKSEENQTFRSADGLNLFYRIFKAEQEKAQMVIAHGLGEHSGRYGNVVDRLQHNGITIWAMDHRGHGRSEGRRGHVNRFGQYVADLNDFFQVVRKESPEDSPCFLLGHSMGGLIALHFALRHAERIDGLIISSPALGVTVPVPAVKLIMGKIMSVIWPGLLLGNGLDPEKISHDRSVVAAYQNDPLVHDRVSARWATEFFKAMDAANRSVAELEIPILMQIAGDDHLTSTEASDQFFSRLRAEDKTLYRYDDLYHEGYNEKDTDRTRVLNDLENWIHHRVFDGQK